MNADSFDKSELFGGAAKPQSSIWSAWDDGYTGINIIIVKLVSGINPGLINEDGLEAMAYLKFFPHCTQCGRPVEIYEGLSVGEIYPFDIFLCRECRDFDDSAWSFARRQEASGAWSNKEAHAFLQRWQESRPRPEF